MDAPTTDSAHALPAPLADVDPSRLVLLLDVDGVLAPIVDDPYAAAVSPTTLELVRRAARECAAVGIVTGRALRRAREMVPVEGAWYATLHGAHVVAPDGTEQHCEVTAGAREHVAVAAQLAQTVGWAYEDKGGTVAIHFRQRGPIGQSVDPAHVRAQLQTVLNPLKVQIHDAKQVLEIKPIGARTKGDAVRIIAEAAPAAADTFVFIGDDRTDIDGFHALEELAAAGDGSRRFVKVAIGGDEAPEDLVGAADVVLDGQGAVGPLLAALLG